MSNSKEDPNEGEEKETGDERKSPTDEAPDGRAAGSRRDASTQVNSKKGKLIEGARDGTPSVPRADGVEPESKKIDFDALETDTDAPAPLSGSPPDDPSNAEPRTSMPAVEPSDDRTSKHVVEFSEGRTSVGSTDDDGKRESSNFSSKTFSLGGTDSFSSSGRRGRSLFARESRRYSDTDYEFLESEIAARDIRTPLRPISFLFYMLETICNLMCVGYHTKGFMAVDLHMYTTEQQLLVYAYLLFFYVFIVITMFQCINVCSGHNPTLFREIIKACIAAVGFTVISILTMRDAERAFYVMFFNTDMNEKDHPIHPFFKFMLHQSMASLCCGLVYMLHAAILIDISFTHKYLHLTQGENSQFVAIEIYLFGAYVQRQFEKFEWFRNFCNDEKVLL